MSTTLTRYQRSILENYVDQYEFMIAMNTDEDLKTCWMNKCILALHNNWAESLPRGSKMHRFCRAVEIALQAKVDYCRARGKGYMVWLGAQFAKSMRVALGDNAKTILRGSREGE